MIRYYQAIRQTWFERGKQRLIKTCGKHRGVKPVGFLNYETGEVYCEEHESCEHAPFPVLSIKAGGAGLNLTNANRVIHFDRRRNPAAENKATVRAFRMGQKKMS